ncbi:hypothetical protein [Luteimonas terrae]|uniref:Uncharacterized protein n=1 Tax=Luteimonas terrae TaxID=1530191 RepID=A0A4V3AND5_9GAMM|nr:hypothetical protein [Luteimonas terrae]TDK30704.1 hypothetical protein E2F49_10130 [Luteimonas terrae]
MRRHLRRVARMLMRDIAAIVLVIVWLVSANRVVDRYYRRTGVAKWSPLDGLGNFPFFHFDRSEWTRMALLALAYLLLGLLLIELL